MPKVKPIKDELLDDALNTEVKIFTVSGGCLTGKLLKYDDDTIVISPRTGIARDKIVSFYQAHHAPSKEVTRPPVR